ncbi:MAG: glutathione peroxidase [Halothiobacillaceae bacterium]|nr:MAG: glutathione peroxidase [Halothiobacillaceae bacterium]
MKLKRLLTLVGLGLLPLAHAGADTDLLDVELRTLAGEERVNLRQAYGGKVVLIVNTASKCGFTGQYEGLEALYARYRDQGFVVLGFPSNDFAHQEPGTEEAIQSFCRNTYSIEFPMFEKVHVRGDEAHPLFKALAAHPNGATPKWNFYKFLLDRDGRLVESWSSITGPDSAGMIRRIETLLAQPAGANR